MKSTVVSGLILVMVPTLLSAQVSGRARGTATASTSLPTQASAQAHAATSVDFSPPKGWSAEGSARLEAMYADARRKDLPPEPIAQRVAEGRAKGASEAAILASAGTVKTHLEASHAAMLKAGRRPSNAETARGATAMEHGVTEVQLETMARKTPSDRSLVVAFDVLGRLAARGVPVTRALAQVQTKLDARASDAVLVSLVPNAGAASGHATVGAGGAASSTGSAVSAAATGAAGVGAPGVTTGVTGAVTGVVKKRP
ncbi:MAG: hypothetical protein H3C62_11080 [Gemmatimonadaceae bacterium]|nr:hypothetical protein [Gemmatimonadaceae bacterium]